MRKANPGRIAHAVNGWFVVWGLAGQSVPVGPFATRSAARAHRADPRNQLRARLLGNRHSGAGALRTPAETAEYLAMIERQGREAEARGAAILAMYEDDEARFVAEGGDPAAGMPPAFVAQGDMASMWPVIPVPGGTLAERIAANTKQVLGDPVLPPADDEGPDDAG